jgi:hypothetical protein
MGLHADVHADDAPRARVDGADEAQASIDDEGFEDGETRVEDVGDEVPEAADSADGPDASGPPPDDGDDAFDSARAWHAFGDGVSRALDADSTEEFLARVLGAIARAGNATASAGPEAARRMVASLAAPRTDHAAPGDPERVFGGVAHWMAQGLDDLEAFDAAAALYVDDGVDEALLPVAALGARLLAGDLAGGTRAPLDRSTGRALLHAVAAAARELSAGGERRHVRTLPRLARSVARVIRRSGVPPARAAPRVERSLAEAARRIAASPELAIRLATTSAATRQAPVTEAPTAPRTRSFTFTGPVTLTISGRR